MYEVGYSWETTKGNIFTVIKREQGILFLHCNKCSLDKEMFPDGIFKIGVSAVTPRSAPCGCGSKRMDARQHTLRAKRAAEAHGFVFEGWVEGVKPRPKGHIKLYNPRNGNRWETACAEGLERGFGCPVEGRKEKSLKTRGLTLEDFEKNLKTKGKLKSHHTLFTKGEDLYLRCGVCAKDDFSKAGVGGDGVFKTKRALLRYHLPCRCVIGCKYTKEQKEFRIKRSIEDRGGEFISLGEDKTTVKYICKEGHYNTTHYNYLVNAGNYCRECALMENKVIGGWLPDRVNEEDYLYILDITSENERYIKIGRSITPERRYKSYRRAGWDVKVLGEIRDTHEFIFFLEQSLLNKFKAFKRKPTKLVKGLYRECLDFEVYPQIKHFLDRENAS